MLGWVSKPAARASVWNLVRSSGRERPVPSSLSRMVLTSGMLRRHPGHPILHSTHRIFFGSTLLGYQCFALDTVGASSRAASPLASVATALYSLPLTN